MPPSSQRIETEKTAIVVVSESRIFGTCFAQCLQLSAPEFDITSYSSVHEWLASGGGSDGIVLLCAIGLQATQAAINQIPSCPSSARIIILSDVEDTVSTMSALTHGAKSYITMDANLELTLGAIRLVNLGGSFVPTSSLDQKHRDTSVTHPSAEAPSRDPMYFTARQLDVLELARQGNPNKIIAYKLNLSQATVKVHLRNMMRKLKVRNRIELILKSDKLRGLNWSHN